MDSKKEWITVKEHEVVVELFARHFDQFKNQIWKLCGELLWEGVELRDEQVISAVKRAVDDFELDIEVEE